MVWLLFSDFRGTKTKNVRFLKHLFCFVYFLLFIICIFFFMQPDIMRTLDVYHFLRFTAAGREVMNIMPSKEEFVKIFVNTGIRNDGNFSVRSSLPSSFYYHKRKSWDYILLSISPPFLFIWQNKQAQAQMRYRQLYAHWQTLIIAVAMGYYFRLPNRGEKIIVTSGGKPVFPLLPLYFF